MRAAPRFALITSVVLLSLPEPGPALIAGHQTHWATERQSVRYLLRSFVSAWNRNDAEALAQLFSPDGIFVSASGARAESRAEIVEMLRREHREVFRESTLSMAPDLIQSLDNGAAVAEGTYSLTRVDLFLASPLP